MKLHADSIVKNYGLRTVLTDIYISCEKGEIVGLLGRNGCGKSTLLKIIFGSLKAESRFVKIDDRQLHGLHDGYKYIRYLPQDGFLPDHLKICTIIELFCEKTNIETVRNHPRIIPVLNKKCKELSSGERRFFEVLLMIYSDAEFVLIDEPFNGLSPICVDEIKELLKLESARKGLIITDHNYRQLIDTVTRIVLIHDGATRNANDKDDLRMWGYIP